MKLEDIKRGHQLSGIIPGSVVTVVASDPIGPDAFELVYKTPDGKLGDRTLLRSEESSVEVASINRNWDLSAPASSFKLALEAFRMRVAHLFDPMMAVHTSNVEPLPHQISAVYEQMLPRMPLRYVLADDPGAGKTIMAGLLIQELLIRADVRRILIVSPGSLTEQWQDELWEKFGLHFEIFSREKQEQSASGNFFEEQERIIVRLDQLSRSEENQKLCIDARWDLVIVDEAHKMSASYFGNKVTETKRFNLGKALGAATRHFLLMTATPHNGKEADFQLFLSLLDSDRFYGKFRDGVHKVDINDIMRRMVKEELLRFDGTRLFPERKAYTINYSLSELEVDLYNGVTNYVSTEMGRAENLDGKRKGTVGFALTILQRRLASSPEAIYQSLKRRCARLEERLREMKLAERSSHLAETLAEYGVLNKVEIPDDLDESEDELTAEEYEAYTDKVVDQATAARTITELEAEIVVLQDLTRRALIVAQSGSDRKWEELSRLLQDTPVMRTPSGSLRKLIIFTEHKDTLNYLTDKIRDLLGNKQEAVVTIHGGTARDQRRLNQSEFRNNPNVLVMIATDAAGEGVNLQNANLMMNYDLPWNPNRLEQRFGRIHRIGQTEVCHLWNLVAAETREGAVFTRLFEKLEIERAALGGRVFDILGEAFEEIPLKQLLIEAIRYGELPETKAKLQEKIEGVLDTGHLKELLKRNALTEQHMSMDELYTIREQMEKAEARKLQPYFIRSFFEEAFKALLGEIRERELRRFEIRHVPATLRERDRLIGETRTPVLKQYERICFEKELVQVHNKPMAELMHPGHPLMNSLTDVILEENRKHLKIGTVLVDPSDEGKEPKMLFMIDHIIRESSGDRQVSRRLQFVTITQNGTVANAGWAPHLDLIEPSSEQAAKIEQLKNLPWLNQNIEQQALSFASEKLVPEHFEEIRERRERQSSKLLVAVHERLTKEINYHQDRYIKLSEDVAAGKQPRMQPENARRTAEELVARLQQRTKEIEQMRHVISSTPIILGGALVVPFGYFNDDASSSLFSIDAAARARVERVAMEAVISAEIALGHRVKDISIEKCGWDVTANQLMDEGQLKPVRHIEVKGRAKGQSTITVTKNEVMTALNQQDKFILAIVIVDGENFDGPFYIRRPFTKELDDGAVSTNYSIDELLVRAVSPKETL